MRSRPEDLDLIPSKRNREPADADVVFLHGLDGDPWTTWAAQTRDPELDEDWPEWIVEDHPGVAVWRFAYPAEKFGGPIANALELAEIAKNTLEYIHKDLGKRPVYFVAHSLGGLIAKQMLREAYHRKNHWESLGRAVQGIFFVATPHAGSKYADMLDSWFVRLLRRTPLAPSVATLSLRTGDKVLCELFEWYRISTPRVQTVSYAESLPIRYGWHGWLYDDLVVTPKSANAGKGDILIIPNTAVLENTVL